jgi:DNA-binding MarR family transcriptional regulator
MLSFRTTSVYFVYLTFRYSKDIAVTASRQALAGELGRAMQAYQRSTQAFDDEVGRVLGLNPADLRCLDWLTEGPLSATRIAEATGLSAAATTSMIDRLERKGFVRRRKHATDRRQVLVEMTTEGAARTWAAYGPLVEEGLPLLAKFDVRELAAMRDHLVAIREITDRQRARLRATDDR